MKLSDGRKVKMHTTPDCEERSRLHTETSRLLAEWLDCKDEVRLTRKNDPLYHVKVQEMKAARGKYKAAVTHLSQHTMTHRCW